MRYPTERSRSARDARWLSPLLTAALVGMFPALSACDEEQNFAEAAEPDAGAAGEPDAGQDGSVTSGDRTDAGSEVVLRTICGDPQGQIVIANQRELDALAGCRNIEGHVLLGPPPLSDPGVDLLGPRPPPSDIHDLSPLSTLESVGGNLRFNELAMLTTLAPLAKLGRVGQFLLIQSVPQLRSLAGLEQLRLVGERVELIRRSGASRSAN
jgi:hypothetical protein